MPSALRAPQKDKNGLISDCSPGQSLKYTGMALARKMLRGRAEVLRHLVGLMNQLGQENRKTYKHWESKFPFFLLLKNHKISSLIS